MSNNNSNNQQLGLWMSREQKRKIKDKAKELLKKEGTKITASEVVRRLTDKFIDKI